MRTHIAALSFTSRITVCLLTLSACHRAEQKVTDLPGLPPVQEVEDKITDEIWQFRLRTRSLYNASKFDELEALANQLRAARSRFANGSWKIVQFYASLACRWDEPESMWQLHEQIHEKWDATKPCSTTAYVAHAEFLTDYAWHARGSGFAKTVTKEGWRLFGERLTKASELLDRSADFQPKCPMWWLARMTVAKGQGWSREHFEKLFQEAISFEPQFWGYDVAKGEYLLPRWHGQPGEWEYALTLDIERPNGLGLETYARVVNDLAGFYKNVFHESHASWPQTHDGFELMRRRYPDSLEILTNYCWLACLAEDRPVARKLFDDLGGRMLKSFWHDPNKFRRYRNWACSRDQSI
jgi:hypothetical protein